MMKYVLDFVILLFKHMFYILILTTRDLPHIKGHYFGDDAIESCLLLFRIDCDVKEVVSNSNPENEMGMRMQKYRNALKSLKLHVAEHNGNITLKS